MLDRLLQHLRVSVIFGVDFTLPGEVPTVLVRRVTLGLKIPIMDNLCLDFSLDFHSLTHSP